MTMIFKKELHYFFNRSPPPFTIHCRSSDNA